MRHDTLRKAHAEPAGTPARILDAAEAVFAEHGYGGTSTREIARRAGIPFGALHYHWGSKRQLWQAVCKRLADRSRETLMGALAGGGSAAEILDRITDAFLDRLVENRTQTRIAAWTFLDNPRDRDVDRMFDELADQGRGIFHEIAPGVPMPAKVTTFVISNAFIAAIADEGAQELLLGGSIYHSLEARQELRAELRRVARATFRLPE